MTKSKVANAQYIRNECRKMIHLLKNGDLALEKEHATTLANFFETTISVLSYYETTKVKPKLKAVKGGLA